MATCKDCLHYEPCYEYGNILDPAHGGVRCDSFKSSADVVEVVRCKDCKFFVYDVCRHDFAMNLSRSDDFCSYGERKEPE